MSRERIRMQPKLAGLPIRRYCGIFVNIECNGSWANKICASIPRSQITRETISSRPGASTPTISPVGIEILMTAARRQSVTDFC